MCDIIRKTWKGRKQTKMEGGQSSTYLRQMRALSGPRVSVAKTYRDETKWKWIVRPNHSGLPQQYNLSPVFYCWGRPLWSGQNIHFRFISFLYVLAMLTRRPDDATVCLIFLPNIIMFLCLLSYMFQPNKAIIRNNYNNQYYIIILIIQLSNNCLCTSSILQLRFINYMLMIEYPMLMLQNAIFQHYQQISKSFNQ